MNVPEFTAVHVVFTQNNNIYDFSMDESVKSNIRYSCLSDITKLVPVF